MVKYVKSNPAVYGEICPGLRSVKNVSLRFYAYAANASIAKGEAALNKAIAEKRPHPCRVEPLSDGAVPELLLVPVVQQLHEALLQGRQYHRRHSWGGRRQYERYSWDGRAGQNVNLATVLFCQL